MQSKKNVANSAQSVRKCGHVSRQNMQKSYSQNRPISASPKKYETRFAEIMKRCEIVARKVQNFSFNANTNQQIRHQSPAGSCKNRHVFTNPTQKNTEIQKCSPSANRDNQKQVLPDNNIKKPQSAKSEAEKPKKEIVEVFLKTPHKIPQQTHENQVKESDTASTSSQVSNNEESLTLKKVTQDLTEIIKNLQQQIHNVPISKTCMEEVPSAMIQPKNKEYFKEPPKQEVKIPTNSPTPAPQNPQNVKNTNLVSKTSIGPKRSNIVRAGSKNSLTTSGTSSNRRFTASTHHALNGSTSSRKMSQRSSSLSIDPLKILKEEVHRAIRDRKTFTVRGQYGAIRRALAQRGWVEKFHPSYKDQINEQIKRYQTFSIIELLPLLKNNEIAATCRNLIKSKLLGGYQVDFYWGVSDEAFRENPDKIKFTMINKLKREIFSYTNKQGLCEATKTSHWYQKKNVSKLNHPRSYTLGQNGDLKGFIYDFHITAAMSLLKWVVKINFTKECKLMSPSGQIPIEVFDFAINECCKFVKKGKHEDIDININEATDYEWNQFLEYFYKIIHYSNHFKAEDKHDEDSLVRKSNYVLNNLREIWPYLDMDGLMNVWILKPTASSRGRGIHMCRTLQYVLKVIKQNNNIRYIIQKYIERPLLIHNTKFDIRQWFLISNCSPLTIWIYKECYLRFSTQTYNLRKLHESIHLTNNSVQCKYKNNSVDAALPSYNMWGSPEFQKYLANIGYPNAFKQIIYPGMKQCITAAVLMHQDKMVIRKNCFELYGADFILTEDFRPWLLEINSNPALNPSTPVTSRMCPNVLEDVIKVVIDYANNAKANTGQFELMYKEKMTELPPPSELELKGVPVPNNYFYTPEDFKMVTLPPPAKPLTKEGLKSFGEDIKKTLNHLLDVIQNEKHKRQLKHKNVGCESLMNCKQNKTTIK